MKAAKLTLRNSDGINSFITSKWNKKSLYAYELKTKLITRVYHPHQVTFLYLWVQVITALGHRLFIPSRTTDSELEAALVFGWG